MVRKDKGIKLSDMNQEDLSSRLIKSQEDLFKLRFRAASAPLKNTMQIRQLRREIARVNTFLNQKKRGA